jgi:hypothetical protein
LKVLRAYIVCREIRWKVSAEEFRKHNYGWARTEVVKKLLEDLGLDVINHGSVQVIPVDRDYLIVLREQ